MHLERFTQCLAESASTIVEFASAVVAVTYGTRSVHVTRKKIAADESVRFGGGWAGKDNPIPHEVCD